MRTRFVMAGLLLPAGALWGLWFLVAPYAPALSVLAGETSAQGLTMDVTTAGVVLGAWFGAVLLAPGLSIGAGIFLVWQAVSPGRKPASLHSRSTSEIS